jgi:hypothetical protein
MTTSAEVSDRPVRLAGEFIDELFRAHAVSLVRVATLLVGDQQSAEDVVQDVFLRLYRGGARLVRPETVLPDGIPGPPGSGAHPDRPGRPARGRLLIPLAAAAAAAVIAVVARHDPGWPSAPLRDGPAWGPGPGRARPRRARPAILSR